MKNVLLLEDHAESRSSLAYVLSRDGYRVLESPNGRSALAIARRERLHAFVVDLKLPDMDGLDVLREVQQLAPGVPSVVMTGYGTVDAAVEAMKLGATDFITKPIHVDQLLALLRRSIDAAGQRGAVSTPPSQASAEMAELGILGLSRPMLDLFDTVKRIAPHPSTVLILGESGTGKELIARALHALGMRARGPFIAINCANLSEQILESELFGHERGAFTSADTAKPGVMEAADGGTLFLDEVNEIGLGAQAKLLRALERREFRRVGGTRKIKVDCNVIAASNVNLDEWVADGRLRPDLYYRLKVVTLVVPPLRDRREAIVPLAERFLADVARRFGQPVKRLSSDVISHLTRYPWPGNVRELKNLMESLTLMVPRTTIEEDDLPAAFRGPATPEITLYVGMRMDQVEREVIRRSLEAYPTVKETARVLGMGLRTLHDKMKRYGLRKPRP
ncbi:MAG TPA: sigma-54 dependent transcriptional regulator [Haliangiales bacterium]|nr:sigma-54 dependent transcriptional regulator [Haliangiales bacterium]